MKRIPLTRGLFALVDDEDYERLIRHKWTALKRPGRKAYAVRQIRVAGKKVKLNMSNAVLNLPYTNLVDHRDCAATLDNRKENLRPATRAQNAINWQRRNRYGRGVTKSRGRFQARVLAGGKHIHLGMFATPEAAQRAYNKAAARLHGEFAILNKIGGTT